MKKLLLHIFFLILVFWASSLSILADTPVDRNASGTWALANNDYNAQVIERTLPSLMKTGEEITVSVTMENTGTYPWTRANSYRLGADGGNQFTWVNFPYGGYCIHPTNARVYMNETMLIYPNESIVFNFDIKAPSSPGDYTFGCRMVREGITWFGEISSGTIHVVTPTPPPATTPPPTKTPSSSPTPTTTSTPEGYYTPTPIGIFYVAFDGSDTFPYDTWAKASTDPQVAIELADDTSGGPHQVWVKKGYTNLSLIRIAVP